MTVEGRWTVERVFIFHLLATGRKEGMNTENTYTYIHTPVETTTWAVKLLLRKAEVRLCPYWKWARKKRYAD